MLSAFAFQAVGALVGTVVGYLILANSRARRLALDVRHRDHPGGPGGARPLLHQRQRPLADDAQGRKAEAEAEVARLLEREPPYPEGSPSGRPATASSCARRARRRLARALLEARTGAPRSSPRCRGSCRTSAPTASASSRRPSWPAIGHEISARPQCRAPDRARHPGGQGRGAARRRC